MIDVSNILKYKFIDQLKSLDFVEEIWLYGSRARGDNKAKSDIDLAIICKDGANWMKVHDIIDEADTLLKVDCVNFKQLNHDSKFSQNILLDKLVLYKGL